MKPVPLPFADFSPLARRKHFCEEDLQNRRLAPSLDLDGAPVGGTGQAPHLLGPGESIDYAVCMRRFAPGALLQHTAHRCSDARLRERVARRSTAGDDASEAALAVLERQREYGESWGGDERARTRDRDRRLCRCGRAVRTLDRPCRCAVSATTVGLNAEVLLGFRRLRRRYLLPGLGTVVSSSSRSTPAPPGVGLNCLLPRAAGAALALGLRSAEMRSTDAAHAALRSDPQRGTQFQVLTYHDLAVTRGPHTVRGTFSVDMGRPIRNVPSQSEWASSQTMPTAINATAATPATRTAIAIHILGAIFLGIAVSHRALCRWTSNFSCSIGGHRCLRWLLR